MPIVTYSAALTHLADPPPLVYLRDRRKLIGLLRNYDRKAQLRTRKGVLTVYEKV